MAGSCLAATERSRAKSGRSILRLPAAVKPVDADAQPLSTRGQRRPHDVGSVSIDGPCSYVTTNNNGNFGYVFTLKGGRKIAVEYVDAQSGWHKLSINGTPAMGYEIDRTHLVASTLDLKQSFEVEGI